MIEQQLSRVALCWQMLAIVFAVLPHFMHLPLWVPLLLTVCLGWRFMVFLGRWSYPKSWMKLVLVTLMVGAVAVSYKAGGGISIMVTLLIVGFGLKCLEMNNQRDALVILYVAYLVSATAFLFQQTIVLSLYVFLTLIICTAALLSVYSRRKLTFFKPLKQANLLILPAIPLMIVLFIIMPRLAPLWEVGLDKSAAKTGLSDQMSPGDISKLTRSAEVAFRVTFDDQPPAQSDLYWRALVFNDFDGRTWSNVIETLPLRNQNGVKVAQRAVGENNQNANVQGNVVNYEIIYEANLKKYVPVLEQIVQWPQGLHQSEAMTISSQAPIGQRQQYRFSSNVVPYYVDDKTIFDMQRQLSLPKGNDRTRALAQKWWAEEGSLSGFIERMYGFFNRSFTYTLEPPRLPNNDIDAFLFDTQRGFCGHFSGAAAFMLRSIGVPARIVTGYQGGEWNPYEQYLQVRQYDAHAWVEYWQEGLGWQRLDPTAFVSPLRIEQPSNEAFKEEQEFLGGNPILTAAISGNGLLANLRLQLEAINYGWHRWVLGYHHQQNNLLRALFGEITPIKIVLLLLVPFGVILGIVALLSLRSKQRLTLDPYDKAMIQLSDKLAKDGLERKVGETIADYCKRIASVKSDIEQPMLKLAKNYEAIRYAGQMSEATKHDFLAQYKLIKQAL